MLYAKDVKFIPVSAAPLSGGTLMGKIKSGFKLTEGVMQSYRMLRSEKPGAVVGMGAYLSVPVVIAARLLHVPVFLHEQNVVPGKATRFLSRFARNVFVSFDATAEYLKDSGAGVRVTGNPVRAMPSAAHKKEVLGKSGLSAAKKTVLVFGGSHGAKKINDAVLEMREFLFPQDDFQMVHVTGAFDYERVLHVAGKNGARGNYSAFPYLENILDYMAACDVIVCRAGATSCAELLALAKPSVLIPYPHATDQHQMKNAMELEKEGAAKILPDEQVTGAALKELIVRMLSDAECLQKMSEACRRMAKPDAAERLAGEILAGLVDKMS